MNLEKNPVLKIGSERSLDAYKHSYSESEYFTGDTSLDIPSPGPTIAKTSL